MNATEELSLRDLAVVYKRRQRLVYYFTLGCFLLAVLYCLLATRRYQATGTLQVQNKTQDGLGLQAMLTGTTQPDLDALSANINVQTQAEILQSDTLALHTIETLHLEGTEDFRPRWNPMSWFLELFSPSGLVDPRNADLEHSPRRRRRVLLVFDRFLSVKPVNGTSLIEVTYLSPDPKIAAAVVNDLSDQLMKYSSKAQFDATRRASEWVDGQLSSLRRQSDQLDAQVAKLENESNIYSLGSTGTNGREQLYSSAVDQLQQASAALAQAKQNQIVRGAISHAADTGDADMLSDLSGSATGGGTSNNSLALIQTLRTQQANQEANLRELEVKFDDSYPKIAELRGNIAGIHLSIQEEIERLKGRAKADYEVATHTEAEVQRDFETIRSEANNLNDKSVELAVLRQEAAASRKLYLDLFTKFKEAGALQGFDASSISLVDPGRPAGKPKKPLIAVVLAIALVGGFILGCCVALVVDTMDTKILTLIQLERMSAGKLFGVIPQFSTTAMVLSHDDSPPLLAVASPQAGFVEAIRGIRSALLLRGSEAPTKVVLITSSLRGEGKSTFSANLAALLAQAGKKVLLVDADLRTGSLSRLLDVPAQKGLSDLLKGDSLEPSIQPVTFIQNLYLLQAGTSTVTPSELLCSDLLVYWLKVLRASYDWIVMDSAGLLAVTDSLVLIPLSDLTLLVARSDFTNRFELERSISLIASGGKSDVNLVLNGVRPDSDGYSSYFGSRGAEQEGR